MKFGYHIKASRDPAWADRFRDFLQEIRDAGFAGSDDGTIECESEEVDLVNTIAVKHHLEMNFYKKGESRQDSEKIGNDEI